ESRREHGMLRKAFAASLLTHVGLLFRSTLAGLPDRNVQLDPIDAGDRRDAARRDVRAVHIGDLELDAIARVHLPEVAVRRNRYRLRAERDQWRAGVERRRSAGDQV